MSESLEGVEAELRSCGRVDSVGSFGLDATRAAEILGAHRLESPYEYVLKLVQAAVASGAERVAVWVLGGTVSVRWPTAPLERHHLEDLARASLSGSVDRWLAHLAAGLLAARALKPSRIEIRSVGRHEAFRLVADGPERRVEAIETGPPETRITLHGLQRPSRTYSGRRWFGPWQALARCSPWEGFLEVLNSQDSEATQVRRRCVYAPVPIQLNWSLVNNPFFAQPRFRCQAGLEPGTWTLLPGVTGWEFPSLQFVLAPAWGAEVLAGPGGLPITKTSRWLYGPVRTWNPYGETLYGPTLSWWRADKFPASTELERLGTSEEPVELYLPGSKPAGAEAFRVVRVNTKTWSPIHLWGVPVVPCHVADAWTEAEEGLLVLVHHGVVVRTMSAPRPLLRNRLIICSAGSLDFDLGGFAPLQNEKWERLLDGLERMRRPGDAEATDLGG